MSPPASAPLLWRVATVSDVRAETPRVRTLVLEVDGWPRHRAGQHVDIRLTAEDGYAAERSYSIASAPGEGLELTVELLEDGEVSPYLVEELVVGDAFEVRGPIGGYFVWDSGDAGPLFLVGGGSGVVPLRAMLRTRPSEVSARLVYSARTLEDVIYRDELDRLGGDVVVTLTREQRDGHRSGRVGSALLREVGFAPADEPQIFVCGPTSFVEAVAAALVEIGHPPERVRTERFGPTGR